MEAEIIPLKKCIMKQTLPGVPVLFPAVWEGFFLWNALPLSESLQPFCNHCTAHGWCITYKMRWSSTSLDNILSEFIEETMMSGGPVVAPCGTNSLSSKRIQTLIIIACHVSYRQIMSLIGSAWQFYSPSDQTFFCPGNTISMLLYLHLSGWKLWGNMVNRYQDVHLLEWGRVMN